MIRCVGCSESIGDSFRFCPWCGARQELKVSAFFPAHPEIERERRALRVSRYLATAPPARHVRFSVWNQTGEAQAAISLDESEAERLAQFLLVGPVRRPRIVERVCHALLSRAGEAAGQRSRR